jgi:hypothetical protein
MSRRFWLLVIGLFAIGLMLMAPNIRHSYLGLWLTGQCGGKTPPVLCAQRAYTGGSHSFPSIGHVSR